MDRKPNKISSLRQHHYNFKVGDASYIAWPVGKGLPLIEEVKKEEYSLITLINAPYEVTLDQTWLETTLQALQATPDDDVWSVEFANGLLIDVTVLNIEISWSAAFFKSLQPWVSWYSVIAGVNLPVSFFLFQNEGGRLIYPDRLVHIC